MIKFINSDELSKEVEAMAADVRAKGITGVPMTIIDSKWAVGGGQSSDVYVQVSTAAVTVPLADLLADFQEVGALRSSLLHSFAPSYQHHGLPATGSQPSHRLHLIITRIWMLRRRFLSCSLPVPLCSVTSLFYDSSCGFSLFTVCTLMISLSFHWSS